MIVCPVPQQLLVISPPEAFIRNVQRSSTGNAGILRSKIIHKNCCALGHCQHGISLDLGVRWQDALCKSGHDALGQIELLSIELVAMIGNDARKSKDENWRIRKKVVRVSTTPRAVPLCLCQLALSLG